MDLLEQATYIKVSTLPDFLQKEVENDKLYEFYNGQRFEGYEQEKEEEYRENDLKIIKYVEYPENKPILCSEYYDDILEVAFWVYKSFNLTKTFDINYFEAGILLYEKEKEDDDAYIIYRTKDIEEKLHFFIIRIH